MQSKTSFFNPTLFRKNLARFWPLWAGASFLGALAPLTVLLQVFRWQTPWDWTDTATGYYSVVSGLLPMLSLLYAVLCAMAVWGYLCNARSVGMMHRLPIRREGLFFTNFLSGMAMMLIPYAVTGGLSVLLSAMLGGIAPKALCITVLAVLAESFFYFASATFAAFLTGSLPAMPVLYFFLHFLEPLVLLLVRDLESGFYYGVRPSYESGLDILCPTVYLLRKITLDHGAPDAPGWTLSLTNLHLLAVYALAGAVLLGISLVLCRTRRSERAGEVIAVGWLRPVFRFGGALLAGLGGGVLLYYLVWLPFRDDSGSYEAVPLAVCIAFMGLVGYYAASMLLEKSFRVFRRSFLGAAAVVVAAGAIVGLFRMDLLNVQGWVPPAEEVASVEIWRKGDGVTLHTGIHDREIEEFLALHRAIAEDADFIRESAAAHDWANTAETTDVHLTFTYHLADGSTRDRNYDFFLDRRRMAMEGTYDWHMDRFFNSPGVQTNGLRAWDAAAEPAGAELIVYGGEAGDQTLELSIPLADTLRGALLRDAEQGSWERVRWFGAYSREELEELLAQGAVTAEEAALLDIREERDFAQLEFRFLVPDPWADDPHERQMWYHTVLLWPQMEETVSALRAAGILETESLCVSPGASGQPGVSGTGSLPVEESPFGEHTDVDVVLPMTEEAETWGPEEPIWEAG